MANAPLINAAMIDPTVAPLPNPRFSKLYKSSISEQVIPRRLLSHHLHQAAIKQGIRNDSAHSDTASKEEGG